MTRWERVKEVTVKKPFIFSFIGVALGYLALNVVISKFYVIAPVVFTYNLKVIIPSLIMSLVVALLIGVNVNLIYVKYKQLKVVKKASGLTFVGMFGGLLAGMCPGCFAGLFPLILSIFGVTATVSVLPFNGLELQLLTVGFLGTSIFFLTKEDKGVCKIK